MNTASRSSVLLAGLVGSGLALSACTGTGAVQPQLGQVAAALQLVEFDSCADALAQLKRAAAASVSPYGLDGMWVEQAGGAAVPVGAVDRNEDAFQAPGAAGADAAAPEYSSTNTHEVGVDEPDLVKTDGHRIVSVVDGTLRVVDAEKRQLIGTLQLSDPAGAWWYAEHLLLSGDRALVLGYGSAAIWRGSSGRDAVADLSFAPDGSRLVLVDLSAEPRVVSELDLEGGYVDARQVDSVARIVVRSGPRLAWTYPAEPGVEADALAANREVLAQSTIDDWLPHFALSEDGARSEGRLVDCADVSHPRVYSGTSMLTVLTVDLGGGELRPDSSVAVVADGQTVYGTGSSLYISGYHSPVMPIDSAPAMLTVIEEETQIHKFDVSDSGKPEYVASGVVDGWLLSQYSMSEYEGHLRVATTRSGFSVARTPVEPPFDPAPSESQVTVLAQQGAQLAEVGSVGGLGKGEQIYAASSVRSATS
jgi:hypothetical protein